MSHARLAKQQRQATEGCKVFYTHYQYPQDHGHQFGMDFVGPFPPVDTLNYIWVVLCRLTSLVHLIPLRTTTMAAELAPLFMSNMVRLHRLPETIVSDRDPKFTSLFWTELHRLLGVLNSSVNKSTGFALFELTYGYVPQTIQSVGTSEYAGIQEYAEVARDMVTHAHDAIIASRVEQTHYANTRRCLDEVNLETGQKAYLSTENLNLPKARARKLMPKYIGPYEVLSCDKDKSYYTLALPDKLLKRRIHPMFYAKLL